LSKGLLSRLYRGLRRFGAWHERKEVPISLLEGGVALAGSIFFILHLLHVSEMADLLDREFLIGLIECIIVVIVTLSLITRAVLLVRRRGLGPKLGVEQDPELLRKLTRYRDGGPYLGSSLGGDPKEAGKVIEALARESASTYSIHTLGEPDPWWEYWETRYIAEWHALWPDTIWRIPSGKDPDEKGAGYFSVVLPITEQSYLRYRRGHLHAAMSTLEVRKPKRRAQGEAGGFVNLLAYSALYVPAAGAKEWDGMRLLYAAVEHLAALLARCWPDLVQPEPKRGLRIICESSNRSLDRTLEQLGFRAVQIERNVPEEDDDSAHESGRRKSPAGFALYELCYDPAIATEDAANDRGRAFLAALREIACLPAPAGRGRGRKTIAAARAQ